MTLTLEQLHAMNADQLKALLRTGPVRAHNNIEEMIKHAEDYKDPESLLFMWVLDYLITDTFDVGVVTVAQVGFSIGNKQKYTMYRTGNPEHWVGGRETLYLTKEEITAIAQANSDIIVARSEDVTVTFPTGKLLVGNYFHPMDELPEELEYTEAYSINGALGRVNTMKWLAENRGIAYGQLGNLTAGLYRVNKDKLIITSAWVKDSVAEYDGEHKAHFPRAKHIGNFDCSVWRFEAVDKANVDKHGFKVEDMKTGYDPVLEVDVNPGVWELKVYYRHRSDETMYKEFGFPLYAELNRKVS